MSRVGSVMPSQDAEGPRKPSLSPEAQRAYNQMRDVEEEWKRPERFDEASWQRERGRENDIGHSPYLEIPRSYKRPRSRAGSVSSTGPASTRGSDGGVEDSGRRKKGHRTHALDEPQRLRTAFVRKYVGACTECRQRKVKCTDFDSTELEANYQATKQARLSVASSRSPTLQIPMSPSVPYSLVQDPNELRGVGSHTIGCPTQPIINLHEHLPDDIELDLDSPTLVNNPRGGLFWSGQATPTSTNQTYIPSYSPQYAAFLDLDLLHRPFPSSYPASRMLSSPVSSVGDVEKPLGFLANDTTWKCQRGAADPWNLDRTDSDLYKCRASFQNSILFLEHYRAHHEPFLNERILSRCGCCGFLPRPFSQSCTKCATEACGNCNASWPLVSWYYGTMVSPAPSLMSGTSTIPTGQGFGNGLLGPPLPFIGSGSYVSNPQGFGSHGSYGSSYGGSMSNQTFAASPSQPDASLHQANTKHAFTRSHNDEISTISPMTTKEKDPTSPKPPLGDHSHHHLPRIPSLFTKGKCTSPTTFSLLINSAKKSLNFKLPCLALAHYLILLLLLFFPLGSSDVDTTTTSLSSSFVLDTVRVMTLGYYHMPLVSVLCIAIGVLGLWVFRCGGDVVVGQPAEEVASEVAREARDILMVPVLA